MFTPRLSSGDRPQYRVPLSQPWPALPPGTETVRCDLCVWTWRADLGRMALKHRHSSCAVHRAGAV